MSSDDNYPPGVTANDIPGWNEPDIDECREAIAGTSECKNRCEPFQIRECINTLHDEGKCIFDCPECKQKELEKDEVKQCHK